MTWFRFALNRQTASNVLLFIFPVADEESFRYLKKRHANCGFPGPVSSDPRMLPCRLKRSHSCSFASIQL